MGCVRRGPFSAETDRFGAAPRPALTNNTGMQSVPYGTSGRNAMGIPVAFCSAISMDVSELRRLIWVSGQLAYNQRNEFVGSGHVRAQTEQCLVEHREKSP